VLQRICDNDLPALDAKEKEKEKINSCNQFCGRASVRDIAYVTGGAASADGQSVGIAGNSVWKSYRTPGSPFNIQVEEVYVSLVTEPSITPHVVRLVLGW